MRAYYETSTCGDVDASESVERGVMIFVEMAFTNGAGPVQNPSYVPSCPAIKYEIAGAIQSMTSGAVTEYSLRRSEAIVPALPCR